MPYTQTAMDTGADRLSSGGGSARHIDVSPDGTIWMGYRLNGNFNFFYSKDGGKTFSWTDTSQAFNGTNTHAGDFSFFIDQDGYMHVAYARYIAAGNDGRTIANPISYRRGTPNAGGTGWTWSAIFDMTGTDYWHCPQIVAHRNPAGSGWIAHIVANYNWSGDNRTIVYHRTLSIDTAGNIAWLGGAGFIHDSPGSQTYHGHVSLDFRHNGDGKTPQLVSGSPKPDLYLCWTSSQLLHHGRLPYQGGTTWSGPQITWTPDWGRIQPNSPYMEGLYTHHRWARVLYDAPNSRWIVVGMVSNPSYTNNNIVIWEYNADGLTLQYAKAMGANPYFYSGDVALLPTGDLEICGVNSWSPGTSPLSRVILTRPAGNGERLFSGQETIDAGGHDNPNVSMLSYPKGAVLCYWNRSGTVYRATRPLSNLWMNVGGVTKNVTRYRNVGGVPTLISPIRKGP